MARINLSEIVSGYLSAEKLNTILAAIEAALDRTVFRDGTAPNAMEADLDLGGHQLLNVGQADASSPSALVSYQTMTDYIDARASGFVLQRHETQTGVAAQTVVNFTSLVYEVGANNLAVYINGVRKFAGTDYTETDEDTITLLTPLAGGEKVVAVVNEFLATIELGAHTHPWSQITNVPVYTTRWADWTEITGKPATFTPSTHTHSAADITSGRLADARRGVYVQNTDPVGLGVGDAGALLFW